MLTHVTRIRTWALLEPSSGYLFHGQDMSLQSNPSPCRWRDTCSERLRVQTKVASPWPACERGSAEIVTLNFLMWVDVCVGE